jgi:hypothetical protein
VLGLPGFTGFLQVFHQDFAALRLGSPPEMHSYAQKLPSDKAFHHLQFYFFKSLNLKKKMCHKIEDLLWALI